MYSLLLFYNDELSCYVSVSHCKKCDSEYIGSLFLYDVLARDVSSCSFS